MNALLSTAYWPNLYYFYYVLNSETVYIEQHENYIKQSFRNRTRILSANGSLDLTVPIKKQANKELISCLEISYSEPWDIKHWRAITSAYNNSPYFEFFEDDLKALYTKRHQYLLEFNLEQLKIVFKILKIKKEIRLTKEFEKHPDNLIDVREKIHPKYKSDLKANEFILKPYYQTFQNKFGFVPNLSILDLLLNKGLETTDYFPKETLTL